MTRGFITIATGNEKYYRLAQNLLLSYKLFCDHPMPFAIMCDRENDITAQFDQVVLLEHPLNAFWDKFALLVRAPYDETIFIDADCLAYADLNAYWDYFAAADDFTGCGTNYPIDSEKGLFQDGQVGEYNGRVHWKPDTSAAVCISSVVGKSATRCIKNARTSANITRNIPGRITARPTRTKPFCVWPWRFTAFMLWTLTQPTMVIPGKRRKWSTTSSPANAPMPPSGTPRSARDGWCTLAPGTAQSRLTCLRWRK